MELELKDLLDNANTAQKLRDTIRRDARSLSTGDLEEIQTMLGAALQQGQTLLEAPEALTDQQRTEGSSALDQISEAIHEAKRLHERKHRWETEVQANADLIFTQAAEATELHHQLHAERRRLSSAQVDEMQVTLAHLEGEAMAAWGVVRQFSLPEHLENRLSRATQVISDALKDAERTTAVKKQWEDAVAMSKAAVLLDLDRLEAMIQQLLTTPVGQHKTEGSADHREPDKTPSEPRDEVDPSHGVETPAIAEHSLAAEAKPAPKLSTASEGSPSQGAEAAPAAIKHDPARLPQARDINFHIKQVERLLRTRRPLDRDTRDALGQRLEQLCERAQRGLARHGAKVDARRPRGRYHTRSELKALQSEVTSLLEQVETTLGVQARRPAAHPVPEKTTPEHRGDAPSSDAPSSDAPSSGAPSSDAPSSDAPSSGAPSSDAPSSDAPSSGAPSSEAPSSEAPRDHTERSEVLATVPEPIEGSDAPPESGPSVSPDDALSTVDEVQQSQPAPDSPATDGGEPPKAEDAEVPIPPKAEGAENPCIPPKESDPGVQETAAAEPVTPDTTATRGKQTTPKARQLPPLSPGAINTVRDLLRRIREMLDGGAVPGTERKAMWARYRTVGEAFKQRRTTQETAERKGLEKMVARAEGFAAEGHPTQARDAVQHAQRQVLRSSLNRRDRDTFLQRLRDAWQQAAKRQDALRKDRTQRQQEGLLKLGSHVLRWQGRCEGITDKIGRLEEQLELIEERKKSSTSIGYRVVAERRLMDIKATIKELKTTRTDLEQKVEDVKPKLKTIDWTPEMSKTWQEGQGEQGKPSPPPREPKQEGARAREDGPPPRADRVTGGSSDTLLSKGEQRGAGEGSQGAETSQTQVAGRKKRRRGRRRRHHDAAAAPDSATQAGGPALPTEGEGGTMPKSNGHQGDDTQSTSQPKTAHADDIKPMPASTSVENHPNEAGIQDDAGDGGAESDEGGKENQPNEDGIRDDTAAGGSESD